MTNEIFNLELQNAIQLMRKDKSREPLFFEALFRAKFLCPIQADEGNMAKHPDGTIVLNGDSDISLVSISTPASEQYLIAFTDWNELYKWNQGKQQIIVYTFEDYKKLFLSGNMPYQGVVINPFSDNIILGKGLFIENNFQEDAVKENEEVMIGLPKDYPTSMVEKLKQYFKKTRYVEVAYLLWMVRGEEASYLLVLGTKVAYQGLFPKIGEICKPYLNGKLLDIVLLNTAFGKSAVENQRPFYIG